ncbi:unnamed protein product [Symbiodinium sp. KB8]|nr:unnamed protein product [Symbiodinium sp. KB8]
MCVSGGGSRAFTFASGIYRALNELNLLPKLEGISSVSGGTWCSSVVMFAKEYAGNPIELDALLGPSTTPGELTLDFLAKPTAPIASGISKGNSMKIIVAALATDIKHEYCAWEKIIAEFVLSPFKLNDFEPRLADSAADVDRIKSENPSLANARFTTPQTGRPRVFVINGVLLAPKNFQVTTSNAVSFQMCPDYVGSPFYPNDSKVDYPLAPCCPGGHCPSCCKGETLIVGGGLIESFAFGGAAPKVQSGGKVQVPQAPPFALPRAVGISSWAMGGQFAEVREGKFVNSRANYWPVTSSILPGPQMAKVWEFGDGGNIDNAGILALLQRGARKVLWICSSFRALAKNYDWKSVTQATFDPIAAGVVDQVYVLFGYVDKSDTAEFLTNNQVFEKDKLLPFMRKVVALKDAGKPAVVKEELTVQTNAWWGIQGGNQVEFIIFYLETSSDFESALPEETQHLGKKYAAALCLLTVTVDSGCMRKCQQTILADAFCFDVNRLPWFAESPHVRLLFGNSVGF